jgi:hypothetical protein
MKLFMDVINSLPKLASVFVTVSHFHPSLIYAGKVKEWRPSETLWLGFHPSPQILD